MRILAVLGIISSRGMPRRPPIRERQLRGFKHFQKLLPLLDRLHDHRVERDRAGSRVPHYDQYRAVERRDREQLRRAARLLLRPRLSG